MTNEEKIRISELAQEGLGYHRIAVLLSLPDSTVKSHLKRNGTKTTACLCCGKSVKQEPHRKVKKFCSDKCRMSWWNAHRQEVNQKAVYEYVCPHCGKTFKAYAQKHRVYCSIKCSAEGRSLRYGQSKG